MNLLVVSQYFYPENFRINEVVASLVEKGINVDVLTGNPNYPTGKVYANFRWWLCSNQTWRGANVVRTPLIPRGKGSALWLVLNYFSFVLFATICGAWMLRRRKYDVIFVYAPSPILQAIPAIALAYLKKCGVVLWVQDLWPESLEATGHIKSRMLLRLIGRLVGWIYKNVDLILAQSHAFIPEIARRATGVQILHYPNSVESFFANKPDLEIVIPEGLLWNDGFTVLFAGNIGQAQAVEVIVDAAKQLIHWPQIHFLILGTGSRWEWMNQQIKINKLNNVRMGGQLPGYMMPNFMQTSDALLVTLADETIFNYTVPNKVQAYLASGRPVIACLNGEGARIIREAKAGMTAPACDANALVDCILQLYRMSEAERQKLGENGRNYFHKHYEHDNLIDELLFHLTSVVNK